MTQVADFEGLTPDVILNCVETAIGHRLTGLTSPLPSYINRVYELLSMDDTRYVVKFYRPGRWKYEALQDEHAFVMACAENEIPVVTPMILNTGSTLGEVNGIYFAVFPKRSGREMEILDDEDWKRMGRLVGRIHVAGSAGNAESRIKLHPSLSTVNDIDQLVSGGFVSLSYETGFKDVTSKILDLSVKLFDDTEFIRVHGDCHLKNFLHRPGEGIMIIDFDDMMTGPPVQDLWLLLSDYAAKTKREMNLMLEGYEQFREFDDYTLKLIEPLRAMRMIYFLAWCSKQTDDYKFKTTFPSWGSESFWQNEVKDLQIQLEIIEKSLSVSTTSTFSVNGNC